MEKMNEEVEEINQRQEEGRVADVAANDDVATCFTLHDRVM